MWIKKLLSGFVLFALLLAGLSGQALSVGSTLSDLQEQIEILQSIEQTLTTTDSELRNLIAQSETLRAELKNSENLTAELQKSLTELSLKYEKYLESRAVLLKNYEGLLVLSRRYKQAYENSTTLNWILGSASAVLGIILTISIVTD